MRAATPDGTAEQMARLLGSPQPLAPWTLPCGTRLTAAWTRDGFHGHAPGMDGHLIAGYHRRPQHCSWSLENRRLAASLRPGTITLVPATHDGQWTLAGCLEVSHVYLSDARLQASAASFGRQAPVELIRRLGFKDPSLARPQLKVASFEQINENLELLRTGDILGRAVIKF